MSAPRESHTARLAGGDADLGGLEGPRAGTGEQKRQTGSLQGGRQADHKEGGPGVSAARKQVTAVCGGTERSSPTGACS